MAVNSRTAIAISNHGNMMGGGEHSFLDLLSNLTATWNPVAVVPEAGELGEKLSKSGVDVRIIPLPPLRPWLIYRIGIAIFFLYKLCTSSDASLVYANGSRAAFYGGIVGFISRLPVIWHCRVAERDPLMDVLLCRLCTRIVANSKATAARFDDKFGNKIDVIYNGFNVHWLNRGGPPELTRVEDGWKVILMVARLSRWKRHDVALSVFETVARTIPEAHLFFVGAVDTEDPEWFAYAQKKAAASHYSQRIRWIGYADDVRPWYKVAYLSILPSDNEPFGRVVVESMACGVPVIAFRCGGIPEIIEHEQNGLLVQNGDTDGFARSLKRLLAEPKRRELLGKNAVRKAETFSLERHVSAMENLFENTAAKKTNRLV